MHIGFGRINLSPLAFRGRSMRRFDRERKTSFGLRQIRLCNFAGSGLLFFFQHFFLGADQAGISEIKFEVNATQNSLLGLQFRQCTDFAEALRAGSISSGALQFFFKLGKIDISPGSGLGFRIRQLLVLAIWNQQRRFNVERIGIFVRLLRE